MSVTRDEYVEKMKSQLDDWNSEIDKVEARGKEFTGETKKKYDAQISDLRQKVRAVKSKMDELQSSGQDKWEKLMAQINDLSDAIVHSFNYFKSQV